MIMTNLLIKNGTVITEAGAFKLDILIEGEKIIKIEKDITTQCENIINADGKYVLPGGIDPHTHMELPVMGTFACDTFATGTLAALYGGTTTIIDFATQPLGGTLHDGLSEWHKKASGHAYCDYGFHMAVTDYNSNIRDEIKDLIKKEGVPTFKAYMAYRDIMLDDEKLTNLIQDISKWGGLLSVHAEDGNLVDAMMENNIREGHVKPKYHALSRPPKCEGEATRKAIEIANQGCHPLYIVHMTCENSLRHLLKAKDSDKKIYGEACLQHLLLDNSVYEKSDIEAAKHICSPPIRDREDIEALWSGIKSNKVDVVATDHCPFTTSQKKAGLDNFSKVPNGVPGVENRVELLYSEGVLKRGLDIKKWVDLISTAPSKIFGLYPKKGTLKVGSDADIVIFNPNKNHTISHKTHHMNVDYSVFEGVEVTGKCEEVILRGKIAISNNQTMINEGHGKYIKRNTLMDKNT